LILKRQDRRKRECQTRTVGCGKGLQGGDLGGGERRGPVRLLELRDHEHLDAVGRLWREEEEYQQQQQQQQQQQHIREQAQV